MPWFSFFIGFRYTLSRKQSHLVAFISRVSTAGLALAVALLITVTSVMNGFDKELRERILAIVPHATLTGFQETMQWPEMIEAAEAFPGVSAATPFSHLQALLMHRQSVKPVLVYGLDERYEPQNSILRELLSTQVLQQLAQSNTLILGYKLAAKLDVAVGENIRLIVPQNNQRTVPKSEVFTVVGVLDSGSELDEKIALTHIHSIAAVKNKEVQSVDGIRLYVDDLFKAKSVASDLSRVLPLYYIRDWSQTHGNLFQAVQMSRKLVLMLVFIIVTVAAFNVVSTLVIAVNDKSGDIAILKTLGCNQQQILGIFVMQGLVIAVMGVSIGVVSGLLLSLAVSDGVMWLEQLLNYQFLQTDVYLIDHLPTDIRWQDVVIISAIALMLSLLATIFPAIKASRLQPAEVLRYE